MQILKLGHVDSGQHPANLDEYFGGHHFNLPLPKQFKGEANSEWANLQEIGGEQVKTLQVFLRKVGFFPKGALDGIFGYRLQSAVRLFQEYVRNVEGHADIGIPNGVVGESTSAHIERWKKEGRKADWIERSMDNPTKEYIHWINFMNKLREFFLRNPLPIHKIVEGFSGKTDSIKTELWDYHPKFIHIIGIRRKAWQQSGKRANDDVFILLIEGMVFKFKGSTDPSLRAATRADHPFIVHGQHHYGFGWHRPSDSKSKAYLALRPADHGVLAFRGNSEGMSEEDVKHNLFVGQMANIQWTANGTAAWTPGSQVIAGKSYIDHNDQVIDCAEYSASSYNDLGAKTKAAYNVMADLISIFAEPGVHQVRYSVIHESDLSVDALIGPEFANKVLKKLKK